MRSTIPLLVVALLLSTAVGAIAQSEGDFDHDIALAGAAHQRALKSKDPAAIASTATALREAHEKLFSYNQLLAGEHARPFPGETREQELQLARAQYSYRTALSTGNAATIAQSRTALRQAYEAVWAAEHAGPRTK